jgi:phosphogluconate dehydratase
MPELHKLTPALGSLQDAGYRVALVTDGRMSGASGKVPAAIHVSPECLAGGPLGRIRDGDRIRLDAETGILEALVPEKEWAQRVPATADLGRNASGFGRELFHAARAMAGIAEQGATIFGWPDAAMPVPVPRASAKETTP